VEQPPATDHAVTGLLQAARNGDRDALDRVLPLVYAELHAIAARHMAKEREAHTLQPTALVHEAYVRMSGGRVLDIRDRSHLLRLSSQVMRRVLVDHARARQSEKRDARLHVTLDDAAVGGAASDAASALDMLALDDALERLAAAEPRWAQVVELRCFGGLDVNETADALSISAATVKRDWRFARAWLARALDAPALNDE
jgi:RNA polymerase sigma factor (TIGR02999 family)